MRHLRRLHPLACGRHGTAVLARRLGARAVFHATTIAAIPTMMSLAIGVSLRMKSARTRRGAIAHRSGAMPSTEIAQICKVGLILKETGADPTQRRGGAMLMAPQVRVGTASGATLWISSARATRRCQHAALVVVGIEIARLHGTPAATSRVGRTQMAMVAQSMRTSSGALPQVALASGGMRSGVTLVEHRMLQRLVAIVAVAPVPLEVPRG